MPENGFDVYPRIGPESLVQEYIFLQKAAYSPQVLPHLKLALVGSDETRGKLRWSSCWRVGGRRQIGA